MRLGLREIIFLVVLLVVPVASYFYVFKPRNAEINQAQDEVEVKQVKLEKLREVTDKIDDIGLAIAQGREAIELVEAKLPSKDQVEVILGDVWQLAARAQLEVKSVKSEKPVLAAGYMEQPLKVSMEGQFDGFYQFLLGLENLSRISRIHEMKLERVTSRSRRREGDTPPGLMKAEFMLSIYYQPG
ncbi:MAG: type IV pilus inner membrane component PilO, partial [Planctomycetota bacterium]